MTLDDKVVTSVTFRRTLQDSITIDDEINTTVTRVKVLQETLSVADDVDTSITRVRSIEDSMSISDKITTIASKTKKLTESLSLSDDVANTRIVLLQDSLVLLDKITTSVTKRLTESLALSDEIIPTDGQIQRLQESFSLTDDFNSSPILDPISNKVVDELTLLTFTATATDSQSPPQTLTFSLSGAPSGAKINSTTGVFKWTPTEEQGPGKYSFTVIVSDGSLTDTQRVNVKVNEVSTSTPTRPSSSSRSSGGGGGGGGGIGSVGGFGGNLTQPVIPVRNFTNGGARFP